MIFENNYKKNTIISQTVVDHNRDMVYSVNVELSLIQSGGVRRDYEATATPIWEGAGLRRDINVPINKRTEIIDYINSQFLGTGSFLMGIRMPDTVNEKIGGQTDGKIIIYIRICYRRTSG